MDTCGCRVVIDDWNSSRGSVSAINVVRFLNSEIMNNWLCAIIRTVHISDTAFGRIYHCLDNQF